MLHLLAIVATFMTSMAHICFKKFALQAGSISSLRLTAMIVNLYFLYGVSLFFLSVVLSFFVMMHMDYSVFYSLTALNYLFVLMLSKLYLKECLDKYKLIGNLIIVIGVVVYNS